MVKIIAVCGAGLGSSFACQMAIEQSMKALNVNAKVSHTGKNYQKLMEKKNLPKPVVFLDRLVDKKEITEKLTPILKEMGEL